MRRGLRSIGVLEDKNEATSGGGFVERRKVKNASGFAVVFTLSMSICDNTDVRESSCTGNRPTTRRGTEDPLAKSAVGPTEPLPTIEQRQDLASAGCGGVYALCGL